jgi:hypothetical protein
MASFQFLSEALLHKDKNGPPKVAQDDNKKIAAIKVGLNTRANTKEGSTFWDDFIKVCGDAESLSHLLGVSKFVIAGWSQQINKYLKMVQEEIAGDDAKKGKRHNMITTGDNAHMPSFTPASNQPTSPPTQGGPAGNNVMGGR